MPALPAFASDAPGAPGVRIVRLSLALGDVQIDRNAGDGWEQALNNMPVIGGARIYAADESKAELEFEDGSSLRLVGPGQISLNELAYAPDGSPVNVIEIDSGLVYIDARLLDHADFRILAPTGESFAITQPSHLRFKVDEQVASLSVFDGEAKALSGPGNPMILAGQTYNYILGQPDSTVRLDNVPPEAEDAWDQQRDNSNDQNESAAAQNSGVDVNAPGAADLSAYGTYEDLPGYGVAWQPNGVDSDWDPFDNGAWCDYPDWGWTFVSGYPWGWTPFYYGNWFYVHGRGWWWRPGPRHGGGNGWHPRPRWTGAPGKAWNGPHPPANASHATVAIAGSHLRVGPIDETHPTFVGRGSGGGSPAGNSTIRTVGRSGATSNFAHGPAASNRESSPIMGRKGSYSLASGAESRRNGYEVYRPPVGIRTRPEESYSEMASRGYAYHGSPAPYHYSMPSAPIERMPSAPVVSSPHISGGSVGGGFHGGGGGGFHGGGGGGFHGGGGGHR